MGAVNSQQQQKMKQATIALSLSVVAALVCSTTGKKYLVEIDDNVNVGDNDYIGSDYTKIPGDHKGGSKDYRHGSDFSRDLLSSGKGGKKDGSAGEEDKSAEPQG